MFKNINDKSIDYLILLWLTCLTVHLYFFTWVGIGSWNFNRTVHSKTILGIYLEYYDVLKLYQILCVVIPILILWIIGRSYNGGKMSKLELGCIFLIQAAVFVLYYFNR